jgi:Icc-related predicted phosphoesterase
LFLTDIHLSFANVEKLNHWHEAKKIAFDIILIGGDTANCDQNNKTHDEAQQLKEANKILTQIQQIFNCKMYFIPGNHDPLIHYEKGYMISGQI